MLYSYRNHSIDLNSKPNDWLLYECSIGLIWVKKEAFLNNNTHYPGSLAPGVALALQLLSKIKQAMVIFIITSEGVYF